MKYSCEEDLATLLLRVTQELKQYGTTRGEKQINETLFRGVTRKLFFNPGLSRAGPPSQPGNFLTYHQQNLHNNKYRSVQELRSSSKLFRYF